MLEGAYAFFKGGEKGKDAQKNLSMVSITQLKCALNLHLICTKKRANWAINILFFILWC